MSLFIVPFLKNKNPHSDYTRWGSVAANRYFKRSQLFNGWRRICQENYSELENPALWDYPAVGDQ
jgi:hypothetical protein